MTFFRNKRIRFFRRGPQPSYSSIPANGHETIEVGLEPAKGTDGKVMLIKVPAREVVLAYNRL